jgi:hypothetical protein
MKKIITILLLIGFCLIFAEPTANPEIIKEKYKKKSIAQAALMSAVLPGSGQFYVSKKSITAYIFPAIEIGLWIGMMHYNNAGKDAESDYEYWATGENIGTVDQPVYRYQRDRFHDAVDDLLNQEDLNESWQNHFRLDDENTQHFYEDIGKYNRAIFGWADWFDVYAGDISNPNYDWNINSSGDWIGNDVTNLSSQYYTGDEVYWNDNVRNTRMRDEYIQMRKDTELLYDKAHYFNFGILANHVLATLDAIRVSKGYNKKIDREKFKLSFSPVYINTSLYAGIFFQRKF